MYGGRDEEIPINVATRNHLFSVKSSVIKLKDNLPPPKLRWIEMAREFESTPIMDTTVVKCFRFHLPEKRAILIQRLWIFESEVTVVRDATSNPCLCV